MIAQRLTARRLGELLGRWGGDGPSYVALSDSIEMLVRDGRIIPGTALPAERQLSDALQLSRTTISASYQRLRERGLAVSRQGSGTIIRPIRPVLQQAEQSHGGQFIDLSSACPEPWGGLAELHERALSEHAHALQRRGYDTLGDPELRKRIADRYTARGLPTNPDQIMVTLGAQHANFLIVRTLLNRGDRSLIESPSYPHAREALAAAGALIAELPVDCGGYDVADMLEIARRTAPRLAYVIPDHHNPTGLSMPAELKSALIDTLVDQGSYLVVDETTAELTLGEPRVVTPFAAFAARPHHQDGILTVGSLGKTVWGGLRVGWVRAAPDLIGRLEMVRRSGDLGTGTWDQVVATIALDDYDRVLADRTRELTAKHRVLADQLALALPEWRLSRATGGVSVWVDLGQPVSTRLCREAASRGVKLVPGPRFGSPGVFERYVRVPFSLPPAEMIEAVNRLGQAWRGMGDAQTPLAPEGLV